MSQFFQIHPVTPQERLIRQAVAMVRDGAVIAYPTDSSYALGCQLGDKSGMERIAQIRRIDKDHNFTLLCSDLSQISTYARVDNWQYRLLKATTPGPFTFILTATHEVPRRLWNPKRKTIGIRVPANPIAQALLSELGEPLLSCTLALPGEKWPLTEAEEIRQRLERQLDLVIDGGACPHGQTTVVDLSGNTPLLVRQGLGDASAFLE